MALGRHVHQTATLASVFLSVSFHSKGHTTITLSLHALSLDKSLNKKSTSVCDVGLKAYGKPGISIQVSESCVADPISRSFLRRYIDLLVPSDINLTE